MELRGVFSSVLGSCAALGMGSACLADVRLPSIISDHMVLQQDGGARIWGWAEPGERVSVTFSYGDRVYETDADPDGEWEVRLATPDMSLPRGLGEKNMGPHTITIRANNEIVIQDVLVGEVWVASGQSNMQMTLDSTIRGVEGSEQELAQADYSQIRFFQVQRTVSATARDDCVGEWIVCSPETVGPFSAVAYYFGQNIHESQGMAVGLIGTYWGGTLIEAWTSGEGLVDFPEFHDDLSFVARIARDPGFDSGDRQIHQNSPTALSNAMIEPITPYTIRGAIWYQGESNRTRARQYRALMPAMIEDWRRRWGIEMPFYLVQIAPFGYGGDTGEAAELREAQMMAMDALDGVGVAVTMDVGNPRDIHPKMKKQVGERLARLALARVYGVEIEYSGPIVDAVDFSDGSARVSFVHGEGLEFRGEDASALFELAGVDGEYVRADSVEVVEGGLVVQAENVGSVVSIRYAWGAADAGVLFNGAGLPASSFRWPIR